MGLAAAPAGGGGSWGLSSIAHGFLTAGSFLPGVVGSTFSVAQAVLYWAQDNPTEAAIALGAAALGVVGSAGVAKVALTAGRQAVGATKGLGNPFRGKSAVQIDEMFRKKGFDPRGPYPARGKGGYVNPKTNRSYHIDEANSFGEPPHVDVNRLRTYNGGLQKKKYPFGG